MSPAANPIRKTRIVCTIGPATSSPDLIRELLVSGMDVARINFSHGTQEEHARVIAALRDEARRLGRELAILGDLQGPKIRTNDVRGGKLNLETGAELRFIHSDSECREGLLTTKFAPLVRDSVVGDRILLNDGLLELEVVGKDPAGLTCRAVRGGPLASRRGINLPKVRLDVPALTDKDRDDVRFALEHDIDFLALSFVRCAEDILLLRKLIDDAGKGRSVQVVAKIEKPEALENLESILKSAHAVMVARGDLGVELGLEKVPAAQKHIIRQAIHHGIPVITATQMLESMIANPWPTRAEVSDVANAVFDGTDAIMLSGETAAGAFPIDTVRMVRSIVAEAEQQGYRNGTEEFQILDSSSSHLGMSLGKAAAVFADQMGATAMACMSDTGNAGIRLTAQRPSVPVYVFSCNLSAVRRMNLVRGAHGILLPEEPPPGHVFPAMERMLLERGLIHVGDPVVYTAGLSLKRNVTTNTIHLRTTESPRA